MAYRATCGETAEEPQLLVPLELGWQRASRGARRSIWDPRASSIRGGGGGGDGRWAVGRRRGAAGSSSSAAGRGAPRAAEPERRAAERGVLSLTESTWLSGPASDGRRQCLVNGSSAWLRSRAYIYCSPEENCKSEQLLCRRMDGRTDERTKGFSRKSLVEIGSQLCCSRFCSRYHW